MKVVLDTSVIAKALLRPRRSLPKEVLERENKTHEKAKLVVHLCDDHEVLLPKACLVEVASVLRRNGHRDVIPEVVESLSLSYTIVPEESLFETAVEVASETGAAGFDCYFMALAMIENALLITDDEKMALHSRKMGIETLLLRETEKEELQSMLTAGA